MIGPLAYIGGKRRLAPTIATLLPKHTTYVEPFCGGAQVFFHKAVSRVEVLNDLDGEIVNFLRICREHPAELIRVLRWLVPSRATFAQFAAQDPCTLTDIQRAVRFLYLQNNAFGGQIVRRSYHVCVTKPPNFNPVRLPARICRTAERLTRVQLEHLPYEEVLQRYDRPTTFFYLDPPYVGARLYRFNLADAEYALLAGRLANLQGKFLMSIGDTEVAKSAFAQFYVSECPVVYTANRAVPTVIELVVSNYVLPRSLTSTDT